MTRLAFEIENKDLLKDLDRKAQELMISKSAVIRQAIKSFCEENKQ